MFGMQMGKMGGVGQMTLAQRIAYMFANSEPGAWYDPSDLTTLFQDSAGTTPVTSVEQPVGLMLDKSGRGNHAFQATTTKRPIYSRLVNLLVGSTTLATQSITTKAAGYKIVFSGTGSVTLSGTATGVYGAGTNSITCTAGTLTLTVSGSVQDASFHLATDLYLPYQGVNTATDYDADPAKFPAYLRWDGVDDAMQTANIDFTGTDKMTVWAGVNHASDAAIAEIIGLSSNPPGTNGTFGLYFPGSPGGTNWYAYSRGTITAAANASTYSAQTDHILSIYSAISQPTISFRDNGGASVESSNSQGTGNYSNSPLYIGSRGGSAYFFNGKLYSLIVRGAQSSQSQIEACELYIKQKMRLP